MLRTQKPSQTMRSLGRGGLRTGRTHRGHRGLNVGPLSGGMSFEHCVYSVIAEAFQKYLDQ